MTENPNTPPDPNAGPPPGGPVGQHSTPVPAESAATEPTPPAAVRPGESGAAAGGTAVATSGGATAEPGGERTGERAGEPPVTQNPATGAVVENPFGTPGEGEAAGEAEPAGPVDPNAPKTSIAATFLPGIDATSVLALVMAALAAGAFLLVNPLVQAHDAARTWSDFKNNVPRTKQDPFGVQRDWVAYQSWAHIILGLVAILLALLVLGLWTAGGNRLRSRSFAQAALVLGLAVVIYGILLKTGAVGSRIPSMSDISTGLSTSQ